MSNKIFYAITLFALLCAAVIFGCKKKDEAGPNSTSAFTNADYAGTWNVSLQCNTAVSFQMAITATGSNGVTITNFHKQGYPSGFTVTGTVSGGTLTIPSQSSSSPSQGGPYTFAGTGTLSSTSALSIPYTVGSGSSSISCTATCTK